MKKFFVILVAMVSLLCVSSVAMAKENTEADYTAAYELFESMSMKETLEGSINMALEAQMQQQPFLAQYKDVMLKFFAKYMSYEAIKKPMADGYLEVFTADELKQLTAFYNSPLGKKVSANQLKLAELGMTIGMRQVSQHLDEVETMISEAMMNE